MPKLIDIDKILARVNKGRKGWGSDVIRDMEHARHLRRLASRLNQLIKSGFTRRQAKTLLRTFPHIDDDYGDRRIR